MGERFNRVVLAFLALSSIVIGVWAGFFPRSFYDSFPGLGRHWVRVDGPYNQHLVRDVGTLNLALAIVAAVAAWRLTTVLVRVAAIALLVNGLPHFIYHLSHLSPYGSSDKLAMVVTLGLGVVLPACVALASWMQPRGFSAAEKPRSEHAPRPVPPSHR
jgi:hypothetical protein